MDIIYARNGFDLFTPLFRYMPLTRFLEMLETEKFHVSKRKVFEDALESRLDFKRQFLPRPVGNNTTPPDISALNEELNKINDKSKTHKKYSELLTSCWTTCVSENVLMWECYAKRIGVRIRSCADSFVNAIDSKGLDCLGCEIIYRNDNYNLSADELLFTKHPAFSDEREVRFYFLHITKDNEWEVPSENDHNVPYSSEFPINIKDFITEVTLSPFIKSNIAKKLAEWLNSEYGIKVTQSSVMINN